MTHTRAATAADLLVLESLLAAPRARGELRDRELRAEDVLVAEDDDGRIVGAVALAVWSADVLELCSLYSDVPGSGLGSRLVSAAVAEARARGGAMIVALTHRDGFFAKRGFIPVSDAPWARARRQPAVSDLRFPELPGAVDHKAQSGCARCPALMTCHQSLLVMRLDVEERRACA